MSRHLDLIYGWVDGFTFCACFSGVIGHDVVFNAVKRGRVGVAVAAFQSRVDALCVFLLKEGLELRGWELQVLCSFAVCGGWVGGWVGHETSIYRWVGGWVGSYLLPTLALHSVRARQILAMASCPTLRASMIVSSGRKSAAPGCF